MLHLRCVWNRTWPNFKNVVNKYLNNQFENSVNIGTWYTALILRDLQVHVYRRRIQCPTTWEIITKNEDIKQIKQNRVDNCYLIELSEEPETTNLSLYCKQAMPRLCPFNVRTNSHVAVDQTLIVRSPEAETIYLSSKSTTFTAARWPTSTRRRLISVGLTISQTAILRSWKEKLLFKYLYNKIMRCNIVVALASLSTMTKPQIKS